VGFARLLLRIGFTVVLRLSFFLMVVGERGLSKLMSYILRHDPESVGVSLGSEGWARIGDLVHGIRARWRNAELYKWVMEEHVKAVAFLDPKQRFEVRDGMIRARYGHSKRLGVGISYEVDSQTKFLYHGTSRQALQSILREGVKPMNRMFVHL
jgi:putative RNA 2'-phosphotransferase